VKFPLNLIFTAGLLQIFENTENPSPSPSPKWGFQSPKFSDSDFREVRGLGLGLRRPKSSGIGAFGYTGFSVLKPRHTHARRRVIDKDFLFE
jgi:hypothetical protein